MRRGTEQLGTAGRFVVSDDEALARIHHICRLIRAQTWAGIDESRVHCHDCPAVELSHYGPGTRGCFILAEAVFNVAVSGAVSGNRSSKTEGT